MYCSKVSCIRQDNTQYLWKPVIEYQQQQQTHGSKLIKLKKPEVIENSRKNHLKRRERERERIDWMKTKTVKENKRIVKNVKEFKKRELFLDIYRRQKTVNTDVTGYFTNKQMK